MNTSSNIPPVSPSEMLVEEFLKPLGLTDAQVAKGIRVPKQRVSEIAEGRQPIIAEMDLRLCRFFGLTEGWWSRLQVDYDTRIARAALAKELARIKPHKASRK